MTHHDPTRDLYKFFLLSFLAVATVTVILFAPGCACPSGDTSAKCVAQNTAVDCGKLLATEDGANVLSVLAHAFAGDPDAGTWSDAILQLVKSVGLDAVTCAISQVEASVKVGLGPHAAMLSPAKLKVLQRIEIWKTQILPKLKGKK